MLSRVAERLYWLARYLERCEDTARLVAAYNQLILDIPKGTEPGWDLLLRTVNGLDQFRSRYTNPTERNIVKFLLTDTASDASLRWSIRCARENMRTTREVLPAQAWELINEIYLYIEDNGAAAVSRQQRFEFLEQVIARCQQITGLIESTVLRDHGLWFMQLGRMLERADMTSRVVDVGATAIIENSARGTPEIPLLWGNLLKSLSATSAYRRNVGAALTPHEVVHFLFNSPQFPRSIAYCLATAEDLVGKLDGPKKMSRDIASMSAKLKKLEVASAKLKKINKLIDELQIDFARLDTSIFACWFASEQNEPTPAKQRAKKVPRKKIKAKPRFQKRASKK